MSFELLMKQNLSGEVLGSGRPLPSRIFLSIAYKFMKTVLLSEFVANLSRYFHTFPERLDGSAIEGKSRANKMITIQFCEDLEGYHVVSFLTRMKPKA